MLVLSGPRDEEAGAGLLSENPIMRVARRPGKQELGKHRSVYVTLARLQQKQMVCSYVGMRSRERGGRRRSTM
jgi:hypothetical protein